MRSTDEIIKYHGNERVEEVKDIIERMPDRFGHRVTIIVLSLFFALIFFGWTIRYPDIVKGRIIVNTTVAPIKLIANSPGKLQLNGLSSQSLVESGQAVALIENPASYETLKKIKQILDKYDPSNLNNTSILLFLPTKVSLGEVTPSYYNFLASLHQLQNFNVNKLYEKQINSLNSLLTQQVKQSANNSDKFDLTIQSMVYTHKLYQRDSILFKEKASAEIEVEKSKIDYLNSERNVSLALSDVIESNMAEKQTTGQIVELEIQRTEKRKELELAVMTAFDALKTTISTWEEKYLFTAPFKGKIQFLRFWTDDQYVQAGEQIFTVVPEAHVPYGQVYLPAVGVGKVKIGQEVIIKLDDFPYMEYGSIKGTVADVSLTTNTEKTQQGDVETYLVTVRFDKGLTTNYGKKIDFKQESKGVAEIVTNDRKLIERFFDNLKYVLNN